MSVEAAAQAGEARCVLLSSGAIVGGTPERVLALAWIRLAGHVAPPGPDLAERVTVLQPFRLRGSA